MGSIAVYEKRLENLTLGDLIKSILRLAILAVAIYLTMGVSVWSYHNALPFLYTQKHLIDGAPAIRSGEIINGKWLVVEYKKWVDGREKVLVWDLNQNFIKAAPLSEKSERIVVIATGRFGYVRTGEPSVDTLQMADVSGNWGSEIPPQYDEAVEILKIGRKRFSEVY